MLPSTVRVFVCTAPQDMRRSFDGLALLTKQVLCEDPQSGALFVFVGKQRNRAKVLWFERNGYCLLYKRLHRALFVMPAPTDGARPSVRIDGAQLAALLAGTPHEKRARKA